ALAETTKHERVYVVAGVDGTVRSLTDSVRLENADGLDELVDRTILTAIQNVGGDEAFALDGETLTWQAKGRDITYQGTSDKTPAILPVVTITLDGEEITAAELKDRTGDAVLTVRYQTAEELPALAVTALLLPEEGVSELQLENAAVFSEMGRQALVGWAVPSMDEALGLPDSFTASFHADHAELSWMMTLTTSDPIDALCGELDERIDIDPRAELDEAEAVLIALKDGESLPETAGKTKDIVPKINELNDGLTTLNDGAATLADGAAQLSDGASALNDGAVQLDEGIQTLMDGAASLSDGAAQADDGAQALAAALTQLSDGAAQLNDGAATLSSSAQALAEGAANAETGAASLDDGLAVLIANNEALNGGAQALFAAVLDTANTQLAAAGLDEAGIDMPELTQENYAAVLETVMEQLNPETLRAAAQAQVEPAVRAQVEASEAQVREGVEAVVRGKVLEAVLQASGQSLSAEQYAQAVEAGAVSKEQAAMIDEAVEAQMETDEVKAQIEAAIGEQIERLVQENTEAYLTSDETIAAKLASAQAALESLTTLKGQLDQISAFVASVAAYTDGAAQAAAGAAALHAGLTQLNDGAISLSDGANALSTGAVTLADGASQAADGAIALQSGTAQLAEGTASLYDGVVTLKDGSSALADGAGALYDGAVELKDGAAALHTDGTQKLMDTLLDAEKQTAEKLLPYVTGDLNDALRIYEETRDRAQEGGYDLRPEGMKAVTVYIIRTDLE
ncbi:MAG: hypothetical protein IJ048_02650, partial [Clostridia bacterium]|nr:hypothetical protein [Clostridia bacterium]